MKKIFITAICLTMWFSASALAATPSPRLGQLPEGICTMDFNPWGNPSQCHCRESALYDERAGLCFTGEGGGEIVVQGPVSVGMAAVGGETTGFVIETESDQSYELVLSLEDQEKLGNATGMWFEIAGEPILIQSVEQGHRRAIIVNEIRVLE